MGRFTTVVRSTIGSSRFLQAITRRLPLRLLRLLAEKFAETRPLGVFPGWRFAIEEQNPTPAVRARYLLWSEFKRRSAATPVRVKWFGNLLMDLSLGNDQSRCLYVGGSFEPNEFALLGRVLKPGSALVDVGANEGFYTVFAASRVAPGGLVISVEPSPRERSRLERNVRINDLKDVRILASALGSKRGTAVLHIADPEHNGQNTLGDFAYQGVGAVDHVTVELIDLDTLVAQQAVDRLDVIKLDVEGAELEVLRGAERTLQRFKPLLLLELFDAALRKQGASAAVVLEWLEARGYGFFDFDHATGLPKRMARVPSESQNVLAIHRDAPSLVLG